MYQFTGLFTERVKCKGAGQCQCVNQRKRANQRRLSVCDKIPLGVKTIVWPNLMLKVTNGRGPDQRSSRTEFGPRAALCRPLL